MASEAKLQRHKHLLVAAAEQEGFLPDRDKPITLHGEGGRMSKAGETELCLVLGKPLLVPWGPFGGFILP